MHGVDGTLDPSFGPDYRASGAGPVIDALRGEVSTPLPSGRYRVAATKGIEWSIDAKVVDIGAGRVTDVELAPRHVVPTPGVLGCDLHVHARPSFDTPVTPEDRVLSLVAAGIDFAVPTEHNIVGDYASASRRSISRASSLSVTGRRGHDLQPGLRSLRRLPVPAGHDVPPFKHTNMNAIFRAVRDGRPEPLLPAEPPAAAQGHRLLRQHRLRPEAARARASTMRIDFDGIEVYNGYDDERPERVDAGPARLLGASQLRVALHRDGQQRLAPHPVSLGGLPAHDGDGRSARRRPTRTSEAVDPLAVVANIKKGHAVVTSGPMIELELGGAHPGDEVMTSRTRPRRTSASAPRRGST